MKNLHAIAKLFSDLNRLKIFALIVKHKKLCVCEICDTLELSQPLVSRHLKMLKEGRILSSEQQGKWVIYSVYNDNKLLEYWINGVKEDAKDLPDLVGCALV